MSFTPALKKVCFVYLALLPFLVTVVAFLVGHVRYSLYIPLWLIHSCIMLAAIIVLCYSAFISINTEKRQWLYLALFLILPWVFIVAFAGMGPPPRTMADWVKTTTEQQVRYIILIVAGISFTLGLALLREKLRAAGENFYSQLGYTAILIAIPFFIMNMTYLGSYQAEVFSHLVTLPKTDRPDWYLALRSRFAPESAVQVAMTYVASASFAASLKGTGIFRSRPADWYIGFSFLGLVLAVVPDNVPDLLAVPSYLISIPAITFLMPYLMGLQFLRRDPAKSADH